jgi:dihydrofolate synthase/folylpolyglutamate synthase
MSRLSYKQATDFLFGLESSAIKLGLDNTLALLGAIGDPHSSFRSIHVAGTNGKGSTASLLNSILRHNGARTGLFTSPHLVDYRERIRIDGAAIPPGDVTRLVSDIRGHVVRIGASYFEATTAVAFEFFKRSQVEVAVVEVGMGGRLDSTNVITPLATCITTIAFDHEKYLGRTLAEIAGEKAGILKRGVPLVMGPMPAQAARAIKEAARKLDVRVYETVRHTNVKPLSVGLDGSAFEYRGLGQRRKLRVGLVGRHQIENAALAVLTAEVLDRGGFAVSDRAIESGLERALWPGRIQVVRKRPLVICDGAHNASGVRALARTLGEVGVEKAVTVFGVLRDKNYRRMMALVAPRASRFILTKPDYPRALPLARLREAASDLGLDWRASARVGGALDLALKDVTRGDHAGSPLLVCGSLYAVGEALQFFGFKPQAVRLC